MGWYIIMSRSILQKDWAAAFKVKVKVTVRGQLLKTRKDCSLHNYIMKYRTRPTRFFVW